MTQDTPRLDATFTPTDLRDISSVLRAASADSTVGPNLSGLAVKALDWSAAEVERLTAQLAEARADAKHEATRTETWRSGPLSVTVTAPANIGPLTLTDAHGNTWVRE